MAAGVSVTSYQADDLARIRLSGIVLHTEETASARFDVRDSGIGRRVEIEIPIHEPGGQLRLNELTARAWANLEVELRILADQVSQLAKQQGT